MSNRETEPQTDRLDALLRDAAARAPDPLPAHLRARVLGDALERMPRPAFQARLRRPSAGARLAEVWRLLGGSPGLAGMTAAGLVGLWLGATAPEPGAMLASAFWQGAGLISPELAGWAGDSPPGFEEDPLLAFLEEN